MKAIFFFALIAIATSIVNAGELTNLKAKQKGIESRMTLSQQNMKNANQVLNSDKAGTGQKIWAANQIQAQKAYQAKGSQALNQTNARVQNVDKYVKWLGNSKGAAQNQQNAAVKTVVSGVGQLASGKGNAAVALQTQQGVQTMASTSAAINKKENLISKYN
jgi:hypothetical protein